MLADRKALRISTETDELLLELFDGFCCDSVLSEDELFESGLFEETLFEEEGECRKRCVNS